MECCSTMIQRPAQATRSAPPILESYWSQLNILMCRVQWILTPSPTDEGTVSVENHGRGWMGAAKALFWLAAAIGAGILIAGLCG